MKTFLRFAKLFSAFFLTLAAAFFFVVAYRSNQLATGRGDVSDKEALVCICLAAIGLAILWQDWRTTRND